MKQNALTSFGTLCRVPIAFFTACSALTGFLLARPHSLSLALPLGIFVFLLACGASALNQYQERKIDALMERTRERPLPSGRIAPAAGLGAALLLIGAGLAGVIASSGVISFLLGVIALIWYNGVYTALKRVTAFAAVPGALVGMIPPAMGWTAAGGAVADPRLFSVCFLFFLWQVPHFWLQVLHHGEDYEKAGLPSLSGVLRKRQIARLIFIWICAAASSAMMLPLYGAIKSPVLSILLFPGALWVAGKAFQLLSDRRSPGLTLSAFRVVNVYILFVMSLLSAESLFLLL